MEAWQFLHFCSERYKSLDQDVKGKVNGHPTVSGHAVSTLDIPIRLLSGAFAEKQKESVQDWELKAIFINDGSENNYTWKLYVGGNVAGQNIPTNGVTLY